MIGYYKYDIYDYLDAVFGTVVVLALITLPVILSFGAK